MIGDWLLHGNYVSYKVMKLIKLSKNGAVSKGEIDKITFGVWEKNKLNLYPDCKYYILL